jgi:alpha-glucosidase
MTNAESAGFTTGKPWLPIADDFKSVNVSALRDQAASILTLYHRLIELRRSEPALSMGEFAPLPADDDLIAYVRKTRERRLLIVLNLGSEARRFNLSDLEARASLLLSTHLDRDQEYSSDQLQLRADEGMIVELR